MSAARFVPSGRRRNSCDYCSRRKKRCDGDGVNPCSCIAKNQPECHYSVRLLTGPKADSAAKRATTGLTVAGNRAKATAGAASAGFGGGLVSAGRRYSAVVPLKRARLSPSPASGLVGLRENVFIGDFFGMMGFLPFTTESFIRKAMVSTVFRTMQERVPGIARCSGGFYNDGERSGRREGAMVPTAGCRSEVLPEGEDDFATESKTEGAAAACVLWSTVGVGCLIAGRPKSSAEEYAHRAREALAICFDDGSVATARAFTIMALFQSFLGNEEKFMKYIQFAKSIVRALPPEEVPVDLTDTLEFVKALDMYCAYHFRREDELRDAAKIVTNEYEPCSSTVKDPKIFQQAELFRWIVKTNLRSGACFSVDMCRSESDENGNMPGSVSGGDDGAINDGGGSDNISTKSPPHLVYDKGIAEENTTGLDNHVREHSEELPPVGEMSRNFAAEVLPECQLLMSLTQSSNLRGGVGELFVQGTMSYVYTLQGQPEAAMVCLWRCAEIFAKSPGIIRFTAWAHLAHCILASMVLTGQTDKYENLRDAYNSVVDEDNEVCCVRFPPIEEWPGMTDICDYSFCRSFYSFLTQIPVPTEDPPASSEDATVVHEAIPLTPCMEDVGIGMNLNAGSSCYSAVSGESCGRGVDEPTSPAPAGEGADDLELLDTSELEGPNAAGLLDALDAFLGEAVLEGFGDEGIGEEDLRPFLEGNI